MPKDIRHATELLGHKCTPTTDRPELVKNKSPASKGPLEKIRGKAPIVVRWHPMHSTSGRDRKKHLAPGT